MRIGICEVSIYDQGGHPGGEAQAPRDLAVMLADGGDRVTDLQALPGQQRLFGPVASETTTQRTLKAIDPACEQ